MAGTRTTLSGNTTYTFAWTAPTAKIDAIADAKGGIYFDTTLNKLRVGGATAWETITSV
jgi:hypothetical protein